MDSLNFDNLDIQEKGIVVFDKGEFIAVREYYNHRVCLYSVTGFFVEVHYSPDTNQIDKIEKVNDEYLKQQNPQKLNILKSTLSHWEMSTTYLSTQPDGSFILEDCKKSKRNSKKTVERLHQHLFGAATNIDSSKEMLEAIKMVSDYNAKNFQTIFAGKKMEIKKSAVKEVYDSIKNDLKATRKELKGLPDVNLICRTFQTLSRF